MKRNKMTALILAVLTVMTVSGRAFFVRAAEKTDPLRTVLENVQIIWLLLPEMRDIIR